MNGVSGLIELITHLLVVKTADQCGAIIFQLRVYSHEVMLLVPPRAVIQVEDDGNPMLTTCVQL